MESNEPLSHEKSFGIIEQMITAAKNEYRDKGDGWLIWGWLLFAASIASAAFVQWEISSFIQWIWRGMGLILAISFIYELISKKRGKVKTYVEEMLDRFSTGFFLSLIAIIIATTVSRNPGFAFGYFFVLYAFWMYIHGSAIRFRPLLIGAFVNWAAAIAIFFTTDFKYVMLLSAFAVAIGYLIPGYMLRSQYRKTHKN